MEASCLETVIETLDQEVLTQIQLKKFQMMLGSVLESNPFYRCKLFEAGVNNPEDVGTFEELQHLPFTTKAELSADQAAHPPYGTNLTFPLEHYTRIHQTSGTTCEPLRCLDTEESWNWWARCWATVYRASGVTPLDRIFFAFSFGPFIGFWSGYEGARLIKALAVPGGGMSSYQRVKAILVNDITVLVCTPTYALHLANVAGKEGLNIAGSNVRITIHAGEPGASIPATKKRIESLWGARCYDHAGATEVGAWGFECQHQTGVHLNEGEFICEVIDPSTGERAHEGELVMTNLGRYGMPVIRYRTGDKVKLLDSACECGRTYRLLDGGIIGRVDDALIIRGVNVFPSAIEGFVRQFPEISEYGVEVYRRGELDVMEILVEVQDGDPGVVAKAITKEIRNGLGMRVAVTPVPYGSLPRFELKAKRVNDHRMEN
jgi:phenylacetate-CoA ligase